MLSHDPKEWERLVASPETTRKKVKRGKLDTKVVGTSKKIKKMDLKGLFSKGIIFTIKMSTKTKSELLAKLWTSVQVSKMLLRNTTKRIIPRRTRLHKPGSTSSAFTSSSVTNPSRDRCAMHTSIRMMGEDSSSYQT